mgnify:CR=1 FL=1
MKIKSVELIHLDVPFTTHTNQHMKYWLPHWRIIQLCKITLSDGTVGWGETIPNYTWAKVPDDIANRIVGRSPGELLWDDALGAGVQQALFDAVGKVLGTPAYKLLGTKVREWCPLSWWAMDMPARDWARQCSDAAKQGYMTAKLKARTWYDLHACFKAIFKAVPPGFKLDLDFNATLGNAASAVEFLDTLKEFERIAMIETPIPQGDVAGNAQIRNQIPRPVAMHYGSPPIMTTLQEDVADGFVVCAGAKAILDLPKTLEVLETLGVPVIAYGQDQLPAFWSREAGLRAPLRMDNPLEIARAAAMRAALGLPGGQLVANPIPAEAEIPREVLAPVIARATADAESHGIRGKSLTPYLLQRIFELTEGRSLEANIALVLHNAKLGARIAKEMSALPRN